jgi:hypothetical protein
MEALRPRGGEEWKTSSGGMFSPRVRASLANFLRFSFSVRTWRGCGDVVVGVELMLKVEENIGERGSGWWTGRFLAFILLVAGTGRDRSWSRKGCARGRRPSDFLFVLPVLIFPDIPDPE